MLIAGLVLAGLAALVHVYIFYLEAFAWTSERGRKVFGTSEREAEITQPLAFNQGFYNLFLAVVTAIGIVLSVAVSKPVGVALVLAGTASMLAAALVLLLSNPALRRSAIAQGLFPLLSVIGVTVGLVTS